MSKKSDLSYVEVTFIDGETKTYKMTAKMTIGQYLARQAAETGILTIYNDEVSYGIPMPQIREYVIRPYEEAPEPKT